MKAKITEMQNSFIVQKNDSTHHFLKSNPMAKDLAEMKLDELNAETTTADHIDFTELVKIKNAEGCAGVIEQMLDGQDSMLVPISALDDATGRLLAAAAELAKSKTANLDTFHHISSIQSYIEGLTFARLSLAAAGVDRAA